jgi:AmmeMemoRadiSam system protein B/AmmeMemoRadiSam system protein A
MNHGMLAITTLGVIMGLFAADSSIRSPAVAGTFYPDHVAVLNAMISEYLEGSPAASSERPVRAVIVPHAGYRFSGSVAGSAFAPLRGQTVARVLLIGPSHRAGFAGAAIPAAGTTAFTTPLGDARLDVEVLDRLRRRPGFDGPASAHDHEHCLEVEIPFLQTVASDAALVPILIGGRTDRSQLEALAEHLAAEIDDATVVVVSTDFSHHGPNYGWAPFPAGPALGSTLVDLARETVGRAADLDRDGFWYQTELSGDTVCGRGAVQLLLELLAARFDGRGDVLEVTTSGHATGDFTNSVSYAAAAFRGDWGRRGADGMTGPREAELLSPTEQRAVADLARAVLATRLGHGPEVARWFAEHGDLRALHRPAGAFVTLNHREPDDPRMKLRACMGVMDATRPLLRSVVEAAVSAAQDPRFSPVRLEELDDLSVEVSVLSPIRRVPDEGAIRVGQHGVAMEKGGRRAVFLPHVAIEQGWDRDMMLSALSRKAGLGPDAWREGASFGVFTAQMCDESDRD